MDARLSPARITDVKMTAHWCQRVRERVSQKTCATTLARAIFWAIDNGRDDVVVYLGRVRRDGVRAFRFRFTDGRYFVALLNLDDRRPITVLPPGRAVRLSRGRYVSIEPER